jgi:hypothetical protein
VGTWLEKTNYPEWRKQQLRDADERCTHWHDPEHQDYRWVNSFTKAEFYTEFKHARAINARVD